MTSPPWPTGTDPLAELAGLGGYFALTVDTDGRSHCLTDFLTDPVLTDHIRRTRAAIAASAGCEPDRIPVRMAASSLQLGVAARLLSPVVGAVLCLGTVPVLDARSVRWLRSDGHAPLFAVEGLVWTPVDRGAAAPAIAATVLEVLTDLGDRLHALTSLSPRVALGNLTSAVNGAVTVLAMSRPELEPAGRDLVRALLDTETLRDTGSFVGAGFRRHSCCLYYQAPGSGLCGDCVLVPTGRD